MSELSYPSAHASTSFAGGAGVRRPAGSTRWLRVVALSRPFLGLHYPSDTVAGAALGHALARLMP